MHHARQSLPWACPAAAAARPGRGRAPGAGGHHRRPRPGLRRRRRRGERRAAAVRPVGRHRPVPRPIPRAGRPDQSDAGADPAADAGRGRAGR
ncbi:hypothetical protein LT493_04715 [Streptomyces tricolor]|nr:hypothetical protein [Streptomyces tricolor]